MVMGANGFFSSFVVIIHNFYGFFSYLVSKYRKQRKKVSEKNYVFVAIPCRAGHRMIQDKYGISSTESRHKIL